MLNRIDHIIPELLLKPDYVFIRHLLVQLVVLFMTMNVFWDEPDTILTERFGVWVIYFLLIDAIIYINIYLLVPHLLLKGRTLYYIVSLPILILFAVFVIGFIQDMSSATTSENTSVFFESIFNLISTIAALYFFIGGITTLLLFKNRLENIRRISELETVTMEIELANLQSQINPHFLFNMLNNANILAGEDVEKSSYVLSKLNDLLRYQIESSSKESVLLKDEIDFLNDFLELEKIRRDRFSYTTCHEGNTNIHVPPLLFIPFVENAIKHNPENDSYIKIVFRIEDNNVYFKCENPKALLSNVKKDGGIGLVNIKKRLELLFGNNYSLELKDEKELYTVIMEFKI